MNIKHVTNTKSTSLDFILFLVIFKDQKWEVGKISQTPGMAHCAYNNCTHLNELPPHLCRCRKTLINLLVQKQRHETGRPAQWRVRCTVATNHPLWVGIEHKFEQGKRPTYHYNNE